MTTPINNIEKDNIPIPEDNIKQLEKIQKNTKETVPVVFTQQDCLKAKIILGFWSTIIFLLPIWLYTTHQQRTPLNQSEIIDWFERKQYEFNIPLNINIRWDKRLNSDKSFDSLNEEFSNFAKEYVLENQPKIAKADSPFVNIITNIRNSQFNLKFSNWSSFEVNNPSSEFDGTLRYIVNIVHESQIQEPLNWYPSEQAKYFALPLRQFVIVTKNKDNKIIKNQVQNLIKAILRSSHDSMNPPVLNGNNERQGIKYVQHYQLTFSLMNEDIKVIQPTWDYHYIHNQFNKQLLHLLKNVSTFTVATQIHHISPLAVQPQTKKEGDIITRYLTPTQLPQFVNSADWNIASAVLTEPDIHFLLYLPSSPLTIQHGEKKASRSFSIPKWGGVYIADAPGTEEVTLTSKELEPAVKQFLKQFKELLDISSIRSTFDKYRLKVEQPHYSSLTGFEMDQYLLRRSMENIFDTASTLNSLITLVNKIQNMVILQKIQTDTQTCLNHLNEALDLLNQGKIQEGFQNTNSALTLAEKSFFDPSMVGLMYFPTEHKYAVYAPLFAPIILTLLRVSIKTINKWRLAKKSKTQ